MNLPPPKKKLQGLPPPKKKNFQVHVQDSLIDGLDDGKFKSEYTSKIPAPIYEPKNKKPDILLLVDRSKADKLVLKLSKANITNAEKQFLFAAAQRHNVFNYKLVADYYAHSGKEMQALMEDSALVIIDFAKAIENGYIDFNQEIEELYKRETAR